MGWINYLALHCPLSKQCAVNKSRQHRFWKNWKSRESNLGPRGEKQESVNTPCKKARKATLWNIGLSEMERPRFESCWVKTTDDDEHRRSDKFLKKVFIVKWMASVTFDCHQTYFWLWKIFIASLKYENVFIQSKVYPWYYDNHCNHCTPSRFFLVCYPSHSR